MGFFDWLMSNREWLFSGVGVALVGAIISLIVRIVSKRRKAAAVALQPISTHDSKRVVHDWSPPATAEAAKQQAAPVVARVSSLSLAEITKAIENVAPLQQDGVASHYVGITVRWTGTLFRANKAEDGLVFVAMNCIGNGSGLVFFNVLLQDYPELGVLALGSELTVTGRIAEIDISTARLAEVKLAFR